mmetsp:Transcript_48191/g.121403  ORF Transcript_48191/g.121403 Transcript_48191/m.121403 type:complete len:242 (+) Transcript_48191:1049-1774(+)
MVILPLKRSSACCCSVGVTGPPSKIFNFRKWNMVYNRQSCELHKSFPERSSTSSLGNCFNNKTDLNSSIRLLLRYNSTRLVNPAKVSKESTKLSSNDSWVSLVSFRSSNTSHNRLEPASKRRSSGKSPVPAKEARRLRSTDNSSNTTHTDNDRNDVRRLPHKYSRLSCEKPARLQSSVEPRSLRSRQSVYFRQLFRFKPVGLVNAFKERSAPRPGSNADILDLSSPPASAKERRAAAPTEA